MSNPLILNDRTRELLLGYAVNVNENDVRRFTAYDGDVPPKDIPFGDILIVGGSTKVYKSASNEAVGTVTNEKQVTGIALSTNVKLNTFYPVAGVTTNQVDYKGGDDGNNIIKGSVAVQYFGAEPAENGAVYIITDTTVSGEAARLGKLTAVADLDGDTTVELTKFSWAGVNEASSGLAVVRLDLQS